MFPEHFHPVISRWFSKPSARRPPRSSSGWAAIRERQHTLIAAPTGSGKTLAAFLTALDDLFREGLAAPLPDEVRVVYVSPLKALSADIHKNLAEPRRGIRRIAEEMGTRRAAHHRRRAHRRHDRSPSARRCCARRRTSSSPRPSRSTCCSPPSAAARCCAPSRTVIVDEIHAVIGTRRGAHLALSRSSVCSRSPNSRCSASASRRRRSRSRRSRDSWSARRPTRRARLRLDRRRRPPPRDGPGARDARAPRSRR